MIEAANPPENGESKKIEKVLRGRTFFLVPMTGVEAADWLSATVDDGKRLARAMGSQEITDEIILDLITRGVERCAQALQCDLEFAAELSESERADVISAQDQLQEAHLIEPFLNIQQAAGRAYLGG